jgi:hypothetical protein
VMHSGAENDLRHLLSLATKDYSEGLQEPVRLILRCEGNEMPADARPQARKNRRRSLLHPPAPSAKTRCFPREYVEDVFRAENDADACRLFAAVE